MKKMVILASTIALLVGASPAAQAEDAGSAPSDAECNRVIKASSETDKKPSPKQLAEEPDLPLDKVNACLLKVRHQGSGAPPAAPH
jgi:hypothetical protein